MFFHTNCGSGVSTAHAAHKGFEVSLARRMSNRWQLAGSMRSCLDGDRVLDYTDPNNQIDFVRFGRGSNDQPHAFKLLGSWSRAVDVRRRELSGAERAAPRPQPVGVADPGPTTYTVEPRGSYRQGFLNLLSVRADKRFKVNGQHGISVIAEVHNLLNTSAGQNSYGTATQASPAAAFDAASEHGVLRPRPGDRRTQGPEGRDLNWSSSERRFDRSRPLDGSFSGAARPRRRSASRRSIAPATLTYTSSVRRRFIPLYAASGAAALIYEVTWTRLLTLQMGHTVAAASTVLAAYMGGLAAGAWLAGRMPASAPARRLQAYAALEIVVALFALGLPAILSAAIPALSWAYADGTAPVRFALIRVLLSLGLVSVPATAMGATFPVAAAWLAGCRAPDRAAAPGAGRVRCRAAVRGEHRRAALALWRRASGSFRSRAAWDDVDGVALNAGAPPAPLADTGRRDSMVRNADPAMTPEGGTRLESVAAVAKSAGRAKPRFRIPRSSAVSHSGKRAHAVVGTSTASLGVHGRGHLRVRRARIRSGVDATPGTHPRADDYAFATMVASFITGLAIGSAAGARLTRRTMRPASWLAALLVAAAAAASVAAWFATSRLPLIVASQVASPGAALGPIVFRQAVMVTLVLLPMTVALGAVFPLALALGSAGAASIGPDVARVYAANTLGAIMGALVSGFGVLPVFGLQATFRVAALAGGIGGACVWIAGSHRQARSRDRFVLHTGRSPSRQSPASPGGPGMRDRALLERRLQLRGQHGRRRPRDDAAGRTARVLREGAASTVSVRRRAGTLSLAIDGKIDASNGGDMQTQRLLGLLPLLLSEHASRGRSQDVCIIGLGTGVTLSSALATGAVRRADVVEISPQVVEASALFAPENHDALRAEGVRLVIGDGRSHLRLTRRRYHVIVSEPSNPWMAGVAALFTREFFEAARARLHPDGLLCQWAHAYDIGADDLRSIVGTFAAVFPQGTMWSSVMATCCSSAPRARPSSRR